VEACQSRRRGRRLAFYARAGVLAVGALMWFAGPAFSAMSRPHPKRPISPAPSRASPPPEGAAAQLSFASDNVTLTFHTDGTATATVPVLNPGQKVDVNFLLVVFPSGQAVPAKAAVAKCSAGLNTVSLVFQKSFPALPTSLTGAAIEVAPDPPASETPPKVELCADRTMLNKPLARGALLPHAQTIPLTLRRRTGLSTFFVPLAVGLGSALLFVGLVVWLTRVNRRPRPRGQKLVGAGSAWNAKDNWVTNPRRCPWANRHVFHQFDVVSWDPAYQLHFAPSALDRADRAGSVGSRLRRGPGEERGANLAWDLVWHRSSDGWRSVSGGGHGGLAGRLLDRLVAGTRRHLDGPLPVRRNSVRLRCCKHLGTRQGLAPRACGPRGSRRGLVLPGPAEPQSAFESGTGTSLAL